MTDIKGLVSTGRTMLQKGRLTVSGLKTIATSQPGAATSSDILERVSGANRLEASSYIEPARNGDGEASGRLAFLVLQYAQENAASIPHLQGALEVAERYEFVGTGSLLLNLGNLLLGAGDVAAAMRAYTLATPKHSDNKYHCGQKLLEFIVASPPDAPTLTLIVSAIEGANDFNVPDLNHALIERAVHLDDFDLSRVHVLCSWLGWGRVSAIGSKALSDGKHAAAMRAYDCATALVPDEISLRLQMGITEFLAGRYVEAEREWALTEYMRRSSRQRWGIEAEPIRFLGKSWFAAIGHVAAIDTYVKSMELGWRPKLPTAYVLDQTNPPPGAALLRRWAKYIDVYSATGDASPITRKLVGYGADASEDVRFHHYRMEALTDEFWAGPDGDGRVRWYGPLGAEVEHAWKAQGRAPLLTIDDAEKASTRKLLAQVFGLPEDAWFVALHVREPGFHANWHKKHPGTRHADISTYDKVIDFVTEAGGWVVRVGDRSMSKLAPRRHVIDYATSPFRNFDLDVFLCGTCTYFIGTNSGLSLLPPLFGRRCVLTNWSPIAIPNWYPDDIYIPKLVRRVAERRHLSFREMYTSSAGWTQWSRDYVDGVEELEDNSPDDLLDAVREIHAEVMTGYRPTTEEQALVDRFNEIAIAGKSYVGSRLGVRFARKYRHLLD